jgi:ectoine hydroxylase
MVDIAGDHQIISPEQRETYERDGYLQLAGFVDSDTLDDLKKASIEFVELSRDLQTSGKVLDLEPGHTEQTPRIRRLNSPVDNHETFRNFSLEGMAGKLACALLGGPVRYHSKLNFKWSDGGEEVQWHQDIQFWPHTDFSPLTIGVYLADVDQEMGPMGVLPGSHRGALFDQYRTDGAWNGAIGTQDLETLDLEAVAWLTGIAGSVTVHNCCMVHGSLPNNSSRPRPLLLQTYSRADSYPIAHIGANGSTGGLSGTVIGGDSHQRVVVQGREIPGAPDWSRRGAPTIFGSQQKDT